MTGNNKIIILKALLIPLLTLFWFFHNGFANNSRNAIYEIPYTPEIIARVTAYKNQQSEVIQKNVSFNYTTEIKRVEWSHKGQINIISSRQIDSVILPHNYAYLKIDFPVLEYHDTIYKLYKYAVAEKRGGLKWTNLGTNSYVILSKLRPGKYTLLVNVEVPDTGYNFHEGKLDIYIESNLWFRWYLIFIYLFVFFTLFLLFFRFQTRALRKLTRQFREREKIAQQIMDQKEELALKNKNITDSINYAKRIQSALMPSKKLFRSLFPESFILHIPKDIVSGDFYWINEVQDNIFIAAVDCTGHGVPGAFMSIIGFELFRKLTNVEGFKRPSDILNSLNEDFQDIFRDVENISLKDGMDMAFCSVNKKTRMLEFSGAFNPLYLIRDNSIIEIKGDRYSVGLPLSDTEKCCFENHSVQLQKDDIFYIFSDGYADQFGGPEGKKYKYRRFRHLLLALHHLTPERQHDFLYKSIMEWKGDLDQVDDILVIGIKVNF